MLVLLRFIFLQIKIFGAYIADELTIHPEHYGGSGETFLWTLSPKPTKSAWNQDNDYIMLVEYDQLAFGSGLMYLISEYLTIVAVYVAMG